MSAVPMEFIDLKTQYARYKAEIDARIAAVLAHAHFIMGPEIAEFETALAHFVGVKRFPSRSFECKNLLFYEHASNCALPDPQTDALSLAPPVCTCRFP